MCVCVYVCVAGMPGLASHMMPDELRLEHRLHAERLAAMAATDPMLRLQMAGSSAAAAAAAASVAASQHMHTHTHAHLHLHQPDAPPPGHPAHGLPPHHPHHSLLAAAAAAAAAAGNGSFCGT